MQTLSLAGASTCRLVSTIKVYFGVIFVPPHHADRMDQPNA
jgi:hypothetical protein